MMPLATTHVRPIRGLAATQVSLSHQEHLMTGFSQESAPLKLPLSAEGYAAANEAFRRCWDQDRAEVLAFLHSHMPAFNQGEAAVLGVGVGDGEFDVRIIDALRERIGTAPLHYMAVEPNEAQLDGFRRRIGDDSANTHFTFVQLHAEEYVPDQQFDLVHYIHSLYHMPASEERLIRASRSWLRQGGKLLIALSSEQGGIFQIMSRFWGAIDYSHFTSGLFGQESLRAVLERNAIPYEFELYPEVAIDVTSCFDPNSNLGKDLLDFLLQADIASAPAELREQILAALADLARTDGERRLLEIPSGVFVIPHNNQT